MSERFVEIDGVKTKVPSFYNHLSDADYITVVKSINNTGKWYHGFAFAAIVIVPWVYGVYKFFA